MNRTTIDFGIDLGTTNSAVAVLKGVVTEIIKNDLQQDITPSAVHFRKNGELLVGFRAKETIKTPRLDDTAIEFKRRMGSDFIYTFDSSSQKKSPEELSAEILKRLKTDVQEKTGEAIEAAVITVPAAFKLEQCDATKKAAQLAGFKESPLLLEPTAAALAFGFQAESKKAHWLVFDFGGGTFDATIIKTDEGTIHVVNHGGDNFLGGSDIDKALVSKIIAPRLIEEFGLEEFDWSQAGKGGRWRQAFARLKWAAEQAKIELSRKEKASLDPDTVSSLKDESNGEMMVEEFEMDITRADLIRVAEPFILRATEITKRALKDAGIPGSAIEKVILVGGPTVAPYFRQMLEESLRIPLDYSVDPFTVVARGAAKFAGTQRLTARASKPVAAGEYTIDFKHKPVGIESAPPVVGRVSGATTKDFTGFTLELVNTKTQWRSGKIALASDGVFEATLYADKGEKNTFAIELYDSSARKQKVNPDTLTYTIDMVVDEQPVIHSIGISLANNEYAKFFKKGSGLPQRKTWPTAFRTVKPLKQGQSGELIWIPIIEGENELADRNRLIGRFAIPADNIRRDLPAGSEVEITMKYDKDFTIWVAAYVPILDDEFNFKIDATGRKSADPDFLEADFEAELKRLREAKAKVAGSGAETADRLVKEVETLPLLEQMEEARAVIKGDPDAAAKFEGQLLEIKPKLDEAVNALEWPALKSEAKEWLEYLQNTVDQNGSEQQRQKAKDYANEVEEIIRKHEPDRLRKKTEQIVRLYHEIVMSQPGWWVNQLKQMEKQQEKMSDQGKAARLLNQGQDCLSKNNATGLQNIVRQLWDLLPEETVAKAKRGYDGDLIF
jgi:molecular chaperone DnaK